MVAILGFSGARECLNIGNDMFCLWILNQSLRIILYFQLQAVTGRMHWKPADIGTVLVETTHSILHHICVHLVSSSTSLWTTSRGPAHHCQSWEANDCGSHINPIPGSIISHPAVRVNEMWFLLCRSSFTCLLLSYVWKTQWKDSWHG